jgi:flagellar hook assembly protein FlgD
VELAVYDLAGRRVRNLASGRIPGGLHARTWDGRNEDGRPVATGVYFYRLKAAETSLTRKVVLLR